MLLRTTPVCDETKMKTSVDSEVTRVDAAIVPRRPHDVSMRYAPMKLPGIPLIVYNTSARAEASSVHCQR